MEHLFAVAQALPDSGAGQVVTFGTIYGAMLAVIIYLARKADKLQNDKDTMYEQRVAEQKEARDKVMEPLEKQAIMAEKTYELLLNLTNRRGQ